MRNSTSIYEYAKQDLDKYGTLPAVYFCGEKIKFRKLFDCIDCVADHLYALGVREGTVVTIHLPNCPQAIMAVYAVGKLGGICNMVHALYPKTTVADNMSFADSDILITHSQECCDIAETGIYVDISEHMGFFSRMGYRATKRINKPETAIDFAELEKNSKKKAQFPEQSLLAKRCAVYMQSTGTTGTPKIVMHSHEAMNNWVEDARAYFCGEKQAGRPTLCILPIFHGSGLVLDMHQCISNKMPQILMAYFSAKKAVNYLKKFEVEVMAGVPAMYEKLLREPGFNGKRLPELRECFVSGEHTPIDLKKQFDEKFDPSGQRHFLYEGYGMTEVITAVCSMGKYHYNQTASGYPLPNCRFAVFDDGTVKNTGRGELLINANTMMMGYLKQSSEQDFVLDKANRWYRTGDLGVIDDEGYIFCTGRIKDIIIHNGYNILPTEIEDIAYEVETVSEVSVVGAWDDKDKTQQIYAFVALKNSTEQETEKDLYSAWRKYLPRYAIPKEIRFLKELPRNRMAKIDKKALEDLI